MSITIKKLQISDCAFILYFTYSIWLTLIKHILPNVVAEFCAAGIMLLFFIVAVIDVYHKQSLNDVFFIYGFVLILFFITYILNTELRSFYWDEEWEVTRIISFSLGGIWAYLSVRLVSDTDKLLYDLKIAAYIIFFYNLYLLIRMLPVGNWYIRSATDGLYHYTQYNMTFGYNMIFVSVVFLCLWYIGRKRLEFIIMLISGLCAFLWGSRGALLCWLMAVVLLLIIRQREVSKLSRIIIPALIVFIVGLTLFLFSNQILEFLNTFLERFNISSRNLSALIAGDFISDTARSRIWAMASEQIKSIFPLGLGAFGDRMVIMPYYVWGYSHNIFLEMILSFGILGVAFLGWLIYRVIKLLLSNKDCRIVLIIMVSMCAKLLVSDSFWFYWAFWGLLAICISPNKKENMKGLDLDIFKIKTNRLNKE